MRALTIHMLSDMHYGRGKGTGALEPILDRIAARPGPIIIPGDITGDGHHDDFVEAEGNVRRLAATGNPIGITPGNHDVHSPRWSSRWPRVQRHALGHPGVVAHGLSRMIVRHESEVFVCLRSAHRTARPQYQIYHEALDWAHARLAGVDLCGARLHLVTHASLWDHSGRWHKSAMELRRRVETRLLLPFNFYSVIHGHVHVGIYEPDARLPHSGRSIVHVGVPTLYGGRGDPNRASLSWTPGSAPVTHRS